MVSALWHGLSPGYLWFFFTTALFFESGKARDMAVGVAIALSVVRALWSTTAVGVTSMAMAMAMARTVMVHDCHWHDCRLTRLCPPRPLQTIYRYQRASKSPAVQMALQAANYVMVSRNHTIAIISNPMQPLAMTQRPTAQQPHALATQLFSLSLSAHPQCHIMMGQAGPAFMALTPAHTWRIIKEFYGSAQILCMVIIIVGMVAPPAREPKANAGVVGGKAAGRDGAKDGLRDGARAAVLDGKSADGAVQGKAGKTE